MDELSKPRSPVKERLSVSDELEPVVNLVYRLDRSESR